MIFHLAIPAKDLQASLDFYQRVLKCRIGRKYQTSFIFSLEGHQVVCHKSDRYDKWPTMYPRHAGIIFTGKDAFDYLWQQHKGHDYVFEGLFKRYPGKFEEHHTFFLKDPSNNLIEFKWYKNQGAIFS